MSKFFNRTQKSDEWNGEAAAARGLTASKMFEAVKELSGDAGEMAGHRLERCRKIHLPAISTAPVLFPKSDSTFAAVEGYRTLRTRLMRLQSTTGLRSVVLSSAVAGEGKTLTALNLALCCAQLRDLRVLLIDGDLRTRGLTGLLQFPSGPGLSEILAGTAQPEEAILATDFPNLHVLGAGAPNAPSPELYAGNRWKEFIGWCGENFKIILVDSPPILSLADSELISGACDGVLLIVRALRTNRDLLRKAARNLDDKKFLGVVFNAADSNGGGSYYRYPSSSNGRSPK